MIAAVLTILFVQLVMGMAAIVIAVVNGIEGTGDDFFNAPMPNLAMQLIVVATMAPIVLAAAWLIQRRPVGTVFSVTGRLRVRWLLCCAALAVPALGVSMATLFGLLRLTSPDTPFVAGFGGGPDFVLAITLIVLLVPFQASAEEIALRGFLMQAVGSLGAGPGEPRGAGRVSRFLRTPILGIVVSGTVFTLLHDYFGWGLLDVAVFGIAMAWLTWYTGGLEAALGLHVVHNIGAFSISAYEGTLEQAATGGGSWQGVLSTTAEVALYCAAVVWLARRMQVRRTAPEDECGRDTTGAPGALPQWTAQQAPGMWRQEPSAQLGWGAADPAPPYPGTSADGSQWATPGPHRNGPAPPFGPGGP
ncbi:hypothetical protein GCM10027570_23780 [Streptomonospora sediminis]